VKLPPLRQRREDIPLLAAHFIKEFNALHGKSVNGISEPVRRAMAIHEWPGNVRELRNFIESMVVLDLDGVLDADDVQDGDILPRIGASAPGSGSENTLVGRPLAEVERFYMERALDLTGGNREEAARMLGVGERTLYRMIQDWKVQDKIKEAMGKAGGDLAQASADLGMSEKALARKLKKLAMVGGDDAEGATEDEEA
ncbi:MAG: helix-turn-helix domain-containing protein, partial [Planctomycetota bacterium]